MIRGRNSTTHAACHAICNTASNVFRTYFFDAFSSTEILHKVSKMLSVTTPWYLAFSRRDPDTRNDGVYMYILSKYIYVNTELAVINEVSALSFYIPQNVRQKKNLNTDWLNPHCLILWHETF